MEGTVGNAGSAVPDVLRCAAELSEGGAHEQALALLDAALESHPAHAPLHTARAWALENLGPTRWVEARRAYETALALDADDLWAQLGLATLLGQTGEPDLCAAIHRDLIARAGQRSAQEHEYLELLGWCQYRLGRLDDAAATFRRALQIDGAWISVRFDLALVLLLSGESHAADLHYGHTLRLLAKRGAGAGAVKVALDDLEQALAENPRNALAAKPIRKRLLDALQPELSEHE
jgi:tetratricopeptide (TPR) repeat protein